MSLNNIKFLVLTILFVSAQSFPNDVYLRMKRQAQIGGNKNPDGSLNLNANIPLAGNDENVLSAIGGVNGLRDEKPSLFNQNSHGYNSASAGLSLQNRNGHSLTAMETHIPSFGDQLTLAGRANLLNTDDHNLNANAFLTRNIPKMHDVPSFNTHGGSLDYMYKDKIGGSLGVAKTPMFQQTDYSAMGKLNLFHDKTSSLDFNAGASRSFSPFIPKSSWEPNFSFSFKKDF